MWGTSVNDNRRTARLMFWGSTFGHVVCVALYCITLSLSWAALQFEGWNGMRITDQNEESP